jgi:hypothetical protein
MRDPQQEFERQRALDTYRIVDSVPEAAYDDIVRLASVLCGVPTALVSLVDRDRQWFKARLGMELSETTRDVAFCDHAIRAPESLLEIPDATRDPRFAQNPLVTAEHGIRFYAGMPLVTPGGAAIGTVCVIDTQPRELNQEQRGALAALARLTMNLLESRRRERELARSALLAASASVAPATPAPAAPAVPAAGMVPPTGCTVAIFELQDFAEQVGRLGERNLERALHQFDHALEERVRAPLGDSVCRVSGSAETIVVLRGTDTADTLRQLREHAAEFERATGMRLISASADADGGEPLARVFHRADEALSRAKDALAAPG